MKNKTILAIGADMKNRFLVAENKKLHFGPEIGDLGDARNYEFFKKEIGKALKKCRPGIVACDLHPGYFSTFFAKEIHLWRKLSVQHHYAHIASVMQEHGLKGSVIGVSFDGTGYGTDGNIWGGEFLLVNKKGFERLAHLKYYMMPGGEKVILQPWRMVLSILGRNGASLLKKPKKEEKEVILSMMSKNINSPLTSSAGRLFDVAAALLGVCEYASYEAEGPIRLEAMCRDKIEESYRFKMLKRDGRYIIDTQSVFLGMVKDLAKGIDKGIIATKFHNSMAKIIVNTAKRLSNDVDIYDIALSGGVFQNRVLKTKVIKGLATSKLNVFTNTKTPVNDLNISLGQYYVSSRTGRS